MANKRGKPGRVTARKDRSDYIESFDDEVFDTPLPVATKIGWLNKDGVTWVVIQYKTPAGTGRYWMRVNDALQHSNDIQEIVLRAKGGEVESNDMPIQQPSGIVIANRMPNGTS